MNFYSIVFERLFAVFHKGASTNPDQEKFDGAFLTCTIISSLLFINMLTIMLIASLFLTDEIQVRIPFGIVTILILIAINSYYFLRKKKFIKLSTAFSTLPPGKKILYTIVAWSYVFVTIIVFFVLLQF